MGLNAPHVTPEKLRGMARGTRQGYDARGFIEAADTIEAQAAEIETLREMVSIYRGTEPAGTAIERARADKATAEVERLTFERDEARQDNAILRATITDLRIEVERLSAFVALLRETLQLHDDDTFVVVAVDALNALDEAQA